MSLKSKERGFMWNDFLLNGIGRRVGVLVFVALIGGKFLAHIFASNWWFCWFPVGTHEALAHVVAATPFTVPTFVALWWFRTYDSRQRLQRANFEAGVAQIVSDTPISIEIGTQILIQVSKVTSAFDSEIALTFVKRLKRYPAETPKNKTLVNGGYRWGYAQHMLEWLIRQNKGRDLNRLDLRHQEFTSKTAGITLCAIVSIHKQPDLTLYVYGCDFADAQQFFDCYPDAHKAWSGCPSDVGKIGEIKVSKDKCCDKNRKRMLCEILLDAISATVAKLKRRCDAYQRKKAANADSTQNKAE